MEGPGVARSSIGALRKDLLSLPVDPLFGALAEPAKKGRPKVFPVGVGGGITPEAVEFLREFAGGLVEEEAVFKESKGFLSEAEAFGVTPSLGL